ncbi:MAG: hypothetical protein WCX28_05525 [Bacteriovoracaceae bacterium]
MGRSAIYMVMGMTFMFLFFGKTMSDNGTEAFSNAIDYYESTQMFNIAEAGANLACNQIFLNSSWRTGFTNVPMNNGTFTVILDTVTYPNKVYMTSIGVYQQDTHFVKILLSPSSMAKFAMYSGNVSSAAKLRNGDTIDGPIHANSKLSTQGNPVFIGKATMGQLQKTAGSPTFLGGYQENVNITFPDYAPSAAAIVDLANNPGGTHDYQNGSELFLKFSVDGSGVCQVQYKLSSGDSYGAAVPLSTFAPTGNIALVDGKLHIEGTIKGQVTITSALSATSADDSHGAVYIDDNVRYYTDPLTNPSSTDMLAVVAASNIQIQKLPMRMDGAFFTNSSAKLKSDLVNDSPMKQLKIVGSLISKSIGSTDFGNGASQGANFYMKYDTRLEGGSPTNFPNPTNNNSFEVLSWFE